MKSAMEMVSSGGVERAGAAEEVLCPYCGSVMLVIFTKAAWHLPSAGARSPRAINAL